MPVCRCAGVQVCGKGSGVGWRLVVRGEEMGSLMWGGIGVEWGGGVVRKERRLGGCGGLDVGGGRLGSFGCVWWLWIGLRNQ